MQKEKEREQEIFPREEKGKTAHLQSSIGYTGTVTGGEF